MSYQKQVDSQHYSFERYFFRGRWMSYWYQAKEILSLKDADRVLDIGPGTTFLRDTLRIHRPTLVYETLDIAEDVTPSYVGSVTKIPLPDNSFDIVCAFQVLEHIKFEDVPVALAEMARVSKKYVIISLPHFGPSLELQVKIPFLPRMQVATKIPFLRKHEFNGQHYWEIGKRGYGVKKIRNLLEENFDIVKEYVPFEYQYHHFFVLKTFYAN